MAEDGEVTIVGAGARLEGNVVSARVPSGSTGR